jgi:hypothetical protein
MLDLEQPMQAENPGQHDVGSALPSEVDDQEGNASDDCTARQATVTQ